MYNNKTYNCQLFVDEILASLGIDVKEEYKGQLGEYLKKLRNKGECKIEFEISPTIGELCGIKEKKIEFKTHIELDKFILINKSQYGTKINGTPVDKQELQNDDKISMGSTVLKFIKS